MATRNLLHKSKLEDFKKWLIKKGWQIEKPKGRWEVFRARSKKRIIIFYDTIDSKEHYSVPANCNDIVRRFINENRTREKEKRDFISIKDQPLNFVNQFCDWWKEKREDTDLVEILLSSGIEINMYGRIIGWALLLAKEYFPVATESKLRRFIEDKGYIIEMSTYEEFQITLSIPQKDMPGWLNKKWEQKGDNLLELYLKAAVEIVS